MGYLLPIFVPEHKENPIAGELYWCTLHNEAGDLIRVEIIGVSETPSHERYVGFAGYERPIEIDWEGLAGYTSEQTPMALYRESIYSFMVIGNTAYSLNLLPASDLEETDSFVLDKKLTVQDILHLP